MAIFHTENEVVKTDRRVTMANIKKLREGTYGTHIYMKLEIDRKEYEVDCYLRNDGEHFKTSADGTEDRERVIEAFKKLY